MIGRFLFLTALLVVIMLCVVELEREHRELQTVHVRQMFQKQILLEEQSRMRLKLQKLTQQQDDRHVR